MEMEADSVTTRSSRRRKTPTMDGQPDGATHAVVETSPSSSSKLPSRNKRDRKPSSSRDTITPEPNTDDSPRKLRSHRSPSKDVSAASKANTSPSSKTRKGDQDARSTRASSSPKESDVDGEKSPSLRSDSEGVETASLNNRRSRSSRRKASVKTTSDAHAGEQPPAPKQPTDLASELFNEDDQQAETSHASAALAEAEPSIKIESDGIELPIPSSRKRRRAGSDDSQLDSHPSSASFTTAVEVADPPRANATDTASLQLRVRQLEMQLAESKAKVEQSATVISAQHAIFESLHGQCICHICLEPSFRPCVLAPCGHVFCIHCLRSWFTKPLASEAAAPEGWSQSEIDRYNRSRTLKRKKICPSCRTELACPPVEVYLVRDMLEKVDEGLQLSKEADVDAQLAESSTAIVGQDNKARLRGEELPKGAKLWEDIFDQDGPRRIIFDEMDGVPRCGSCGSEIFDGACSNPSCAIEYDSHSDYEDLRRGGWDDMDDFDSGHDSQDDEGPRRPRRNGALAERLADFEARHGRSEGLDRGHRLELLDDFTDVTYIDSSDNEHMVRDYTDQRGERVGQRFHDEDEIDEDDEDDEEMDDFIVRDDFDEDDDMLDRPRAYFDGSASEDDEGSYGMGSAPYSEGEEDDFLPGPRRGGRGSAIEISDDDEDTGDRDSSVEYRGHRGGQRVRSRVADSDDDDDGDDDGGDDGYGDSGDGPTGSEGESESNEDEREARLGSSNDSSARRRRARIVDDEDEDEVDEDEL